MTLAAFDTLKFVKRLQGAGVPVAQAEAEAEVLAEIFESNLQQLATKEDLQREIGILRNDMDGKHELLRKDMDAKHELLRKDMDAKHEMLRKDMDNKHESLRNDMHTMAERFDAKLDKLGLTLTIRLTFIMIGVMSAAVTLNKLF
ncbi:CCDC90 family protein [Mycoavidus sp. SF9855]|uniref:CCDC90 family protein n=1 Tax=Mycoavidus sp. SF9855 TaxID=2968475 RepID=UPI00211CAB8B|nr:CCDC90 family protein [Mycoavidus sp. SF9855]UUM21593.1 CCDC90 family protein [Mycoavidus sp. SF9855]